MTADGQSPIDASVSPAPSAVVLLDAAERVNVAMLREAIALMDEATGLVMQHKRYAPLTREEAALALSVATRLSEIAGWLVIETAEDPAPEPQRARAARALMKAGAIDRSSALSVDLSEAMDGDALGSTEWGPAFADDEEDWDGDGDGDDIQRPASLDETVAEWPAMADIERQAIRLANRVIRIGSVDAVAGAPVHS
ncbi:MAG: hypothetical protein AAFV62_07635 [Pseudomonadota bacterium]